MTPLGTSTGHLVAGLGGSTKLPLPARPYAGCVRRETMIAYRVVNGQWQVAPVASETVALLVEIATLRARIARMRAEIANGGAL